MKTFGLFILLFLAFTIALSLSLPKDWSVPQVMLQSTLLAYIMQQYLAKEIDEE